MDFHYVYVVIDKYGCPQSAHMLQAGAEELVQMSNANGDFGLSFVKVPLYE